MALLQDSGREDWARKLGLAGLKRVAFLVEGLDTCLPLRPLVLVSSLYQESYQEKGLRRPVYGVVPFCKEDRVEKYLLVPMSGSELNRLVKAEANNYVGVLVGAKKRDELVLPLNPMDSVFSTHVVSMLPRQQEVFGCFVPPSVRTLTDAEVFRHGLRGDAEELFLFVSSGSPYLKEAVSLAMPEVPNKFVFRAGPTESELRREVLSVVFKYDTYHELVGEATPMTLGEVKGALNGHHQQTVLVEVSREEAGKANGWKHPDRVVSRFNGSMPDGDGLVIPFTTRSRKENEILFPGCASLAERYYMLVRFGTPEHVQALKEAVGAVE